MNNKATVRMGIILAAAYIACQMVADVTAVKLISVFGTVIPAGTWVYAATFTLRDLIHRRLGKWAARTAILAAGVINVLMAIYFVAAVAMPYPPFWEAQDAYAMVLGVVPSIVVASIIAEVLSELADTELYQWAADKRWPHWLRIVWSNLWSVPLDSVLFGGLAFVVAPMVLSSGDAMPLSALWSMVVGQSIFKWIVATVVMPLSYLSRTSEGRA